MNITINARLTEPEHLAQCKKFYFDEYNYYFNEQEKIKEKITFALNEKTNPYSFKDWFRLTNTQYASHPLHCKGSMENIPGGRFNIGSINFNRFPVFPALYLANGKETCIKEVYEGMSQFFSAKRGDSFFPVSGYINIVLDITKKGSLNKFLKVIKKITPSEEIKKRAKQLKLPSPESVQNITQFKKDLYNKSWRNRPNIFDIPASSQIFGQLVRNAGIEAILYQSTKHSKSGLCLAIFPENFKNSESYITLQESAKNIKSKRLDLKSYEQFY